MTNIDELAARTTATGWQLMGVALLCSAAITGLIVCRLREHRQHLRRPAGATDDPPRARGRSLTPWAVRLLLVGDAIHKVRTTLPADDPRHAALADAGRTIRELVESATEGVVNA